MSGAPAFSIVIPAYNYAHFLRRAVTSACTQEGADAEVLVIDDDPPSGWRVYRAGRLPSLYHEQ